MKRLLLTVLGLCLASQVWAGAASVTSHRKDGDWVRIVIDATSAAVNQIDTLIVNTSGMRFDTAGASTGSELMMHVFAVQADGDSIDVRTDYSEDRTNWTAAFVGNAVYGGDENEVLHASDKFARFLRFRITNVDDTVNTYTLTLLVRRAKDLE